MSTIKILPTRASLHTQNDIRKSNRTRKPLRYVEIYLPTASSTQTSQRLTSVYYLATLQGNFYHDTRGIFFDENQSRWF